MRRKLYLIDYEENGQDKHKSVECTSIGCLTDSEMVQMLHFYVGKNNRLSSVVEFTTDLSLDEFDKVCDMPDIFTIPYRVLCVDMEEMKKAKEMLSK